MSITNKYNESNYRLGTSLNRGYFYDLTPTVKKIEKMELLYSKNLFDKHLSVDVNPNSKEVYYISDKTINSTNMLTNILGENDYNNGLSPFSSWETLRKVNSEIQSLNSVDSILFKRGDRFYGTLRIRRSD